jgi:hypothetical protein
MEEELSRIPEHTRVSAPSQAVVSVCYANGQVSGGQTFTEAHGVAQRE